jgi:hypothetical protein
MSRPFHVLFNLVPLEHEKHRQACENHSTKGQPLLVESTWTSGLIASFLFAETFFLLSCDTGKLIIYVSYVRQISAKTVLRNMLHCDN